MELLKRTGKNIKAFFPAMVVAVVAYFVLDDLLIGNPLIVTFIVSFFIFLFGFFLSFLVAILDGWKSKR